VEILGFWHYISELGDYLLARNLLLSGSILQEAYYTPMSRIIATVNDVGYTTTTQAYSLVPRFLAAKRQLCNIRNNALHSYSCQTTRVSTLVTRREKTIVNSVVMSMSNEYNTPRNVSPSDTRVVCVVVFIDDDTKEEI
jgi:hypothetical protein